MPICTPPERSEWQVRSWDLCLRLCKGSCSRHESSGEMSCHTMAHARQAGHGTPPLRPPTAVWCRRHGSLPVGGLHDADRRAGHRPKGGSRPDKSRTDSERGCRRIPNSGGAGWLAWMAWWYFDSTSFPYHSLTQKVVSNFSIRYLSYGRTVLQQKRAPLFCAACFL